MEKQKNMTIIYMEKEMKKEKSIKVKWYLKENMHMEKGMEKEKNIILLVEYNLKENI